MKKKFCKDCRWCEPFIVGEKTKDFKSARCVYPIGRTINKQLGEEETVYQQWSFCKTLRNISFIFAYVFGACGVQGRFWRRKSERRKENRLNAHN